LVVNVQIIVIVYVYIFKIKLHYINIFFSKLLISLKLKKLYLMSTQELANATNINITYLESLIELNKQAIDTTWLENCAYLVFFMQCGFAFLEAGNVRYKNVLITLFKNCIDVCCGTICWWIIGYAFAFGDDRGRFIGASFFAGDKINTYDKYNLWMFNWALAAASTTIVSGCVVERMHIWGYVLISSFINAWTYPVVVHWAWHKEGWLKHMGFHDFGGCAVVHMVGGVTGLAATLMLGPRNGKFLKKDQKVPPHYDDEFKPTNLPFVVLGTLILWFCWYGFNCGSVITMVGNQLLVGKSAMNTTLGAATGGLFSFFIHYFTHRNTNNKYSLAVLCNGILAGCVGITGAADVVASWAAVVIALIAVLIYYFYIWFLKLLKIDDPLDAVALHFGVASWGCVAVGWFHESKGILYGGGGKQFGVNLLGVVVSFAWTFTFTCLLNLVLKLLGLFRISAIEEFRGSDPECCGSYSQNYDCVSKIELAKIINKSENNNPLEIFDSSELKAQSVETEKVDTKFSKINLDKNNQLSTERYIINTVPLETEQTLKASNQ
jgi:Amt family ammonium transporter